jgi:hypothetical protein
MSRALGLALLALSLGGCSLFTVRAAPATMKPAPPTRTSDSLQPVESVGETRSEIGPVLIIQRFGEMTFNGSFVIVDNPKDWEYARGLVQALYGGAAGGPQVQTVDDFIIGQKARLKADSVAPKLDIEQVRRDIIDDLKGHRAVVYRFISSPKQ